MTCEFQRDSFRQTNLPGEQIFTQMTNQYLLPLTLCGNSSSAGFQAGNLALSNASTEKPAGQGNRQLSNLQVHPQL